MRSQSLSDRLSAWATLSRLGTIADVLFKIAALVAALAAANFFIYEPEVTLQSRLQAFIDVDALRASYGADGEPMPAIVRRVADEYNAANAADLRSGANSTAGKVPAAQLCERSPRTVRAVFPEADCRSARVTIGRARYYERLLLARNADRRRPLSTSDLRVALGRLRSAEYLRARCAVSNVGNAKAVNVQIRPSDGFFRPGAVANDPFPLDAGDDFHRDFRSSPGAFDRDPELEFAVDWTRGGLTDTGLTTLVAAVMLALFALVLVNDVVRSVRARREEPSDDEDAQREQAGDRPT